MKRIVVSAALFAAALAPLLCAAEKGQTYAFLVACSEYAGEFRTLANTAAEMKDFRQTLIDSGVPAANIKFLHDKAGPRLICMKEQIDREFGLLLSRAGADDTVIVALNGHGLHLEGDGVSYFLPADARLEGKKNFVPLTGKGGLYEKLAGCDAGRKLLLVNACRNDAIDDKSFAARKVTIDKKKKDDVPKGIAALFSCRPSEKSYEYPRGKGPGVERSLFYHHLIEAWGGKYADGKPVTVEHVFDEVIRRTNADADEHLGEAQKPEPVRGYSGEWVLRGAKVEVRAKTFTNVAGMKMVRIPGTREQYPKKGTFTMGSPKDEKERSDDEAQHEVEVSEFYLGAHEVTVAQFRAFATDAGYKTEAEKVGLANTWKKPGIEQKDDHPVVYVSWNDAKAYCEWLTKKADKNSLAGHSYRLPREAEWEYACRGGDASYKTFHFGDVLDDAGSQANFNGNYPYGSERKSTYLKTTKPVGSYKANGFGLHDMHGNVWEWCADRYGADYYAKSDGAKDPEGPSVGLNDRVFRGGGWGDYARGCRSACRTRRGPFSQDRFIGFRVALVPSGRAKME